jgi:hypothetical protein
LAAKENNMYMIDVMKRLAELDSKNPNIVKENVQVGECGMMPEMGMDLAPEKPSMPASINMTAGSGDELSNMLATIMQLAGQNKPVSAAPALDNTPPAPGALEPASGPMSQTDNMRSVIDKLNPMDDNGEDDVNKAHGDLDNDGDHDMDDHDMEKKNKVDEYDNTPADPNDKDEFDANAHAHQENQPGQGDRMDGDRPKAYADMKEAVTDLFAQYKKFVTESVQFGEQGRDLTNTPRDQFISRMSPSVDNNALLQKVGKVVNSPEFNSDTILKIVDSPNITHPVGLYIQKEFDELQYNLGSAYEDHPEEVAEKLLSMLKDRTHQYVAEGSAHGYNVVRYYEKTGDQMKLTNWLRKQAGLPKDAPVYFDDADLVYGDKTIVPGALVNPKLKFNDLLTALTQATGGQGKQNMDGVYREQGLQESRWNQKSSKKTSRAVKGVSKN